MPASSSLEGQKRSRTPSWACSYRSFPLHHRPSSVFIQLRSFQAPSVPRTGTKQACRPLTHQAQQSHGNILLLSRCTPPQSPALVCGPTWISMTFRCLWIKCLPHLPIATRSKPHQAQHNFTAFQSPQHHSHQSRMYRPRSHQSHTHRPSTRQHQHQPQFRSHPNYHPHLFSTNAVQVRALALAASAGTAMTT